MFRILIRREGRGTLEVPHMAPQRPCALQLF